MNEAEFERLEERVWRFMTAGEGTFDELAREIYAFQFRSNEPFRKYCLYRGGGEAVASWEDIPAVPQQAFKMSRLAVFPENRTLREFRTSGTTGEGFGSHFFTSLRLYDAAIQAGWDFAQLPRYQAFLLVPPPEEAPHSSLSYMLDLLVGKDRSYFRTGKLATRELRQDISKQRGPIMLLGTALAFLNLAEQETKGLPLPTGSLVMETGGYKGSGRTLEKSELYRRLSDFFSLPLQSFINEYGMTELTSQYYTRGLDQPHRAGPWIRHRIVDPANGKRVAVGEQGVLQLFDLGNLGSALAVQTEDLAVENGDSFFLLGRDPSAVARGCSRNADEVLRR